MPQVQVIGNMSLLNCITMQFNSLKYFYNISQNIYILCKTYLTIGMNMIKIALTKLSSKGQIVIPSELRKGLAVGEQLIIIKGKNQLILKRVKDIDKKFQEDLEFAKKTEEALKKYEQGEFKEVDGDKFLKMLKKW